MFTLPDPVQSKVYAEDIAPNLKAGDTLMFAHGFNIRFGFIQPPANVDVTMVAPKAPGHRVREVFKEGSGVPALVAVHQDASGKALAERAGLCQGHRLARAPVCWKPPSPKRPKPTSLASRPCCAAACSELVKAGFYTLVEAGYQPEIAYFECLHELKLIVDLMYQGGLSYMRYSVSDTAEWGDYKSGPRIVTDETRKAACADPGRDPERRLCRRVDGRVSQRRQASCMATRKAEQGQQIEQVGKQLRGMMTFLNAKVVE